MTPVPPTQCPNCEVLTERVAQFEKRVFDKFEAQREAVNFALNAAKEAVSKAETAADKRFEVQNELRGALNDLSGRMMLRLDFEAQHRALIDKLDEALQGIRDRLDGPSGLATTVQGLLARAGKGDEDMNSARQVKQWVVGLVVVGALSVLGWIVTLLSFISKKGG